MKFCAICGDDTLNNSTNCAFCACNSQNFKKYNNIKKATTVMEVASSELHHSNSSSDEEEIISHLDVVKEEDNLHDELKADQDNKEENEKIEDDDEEEDDDDLDLEDKDDDQDDRDIVEVNENKPSQEEGYFTFDDDEEDDKEAEDFKTPFWFGHEDTDQIKGIIDEMTTLLQLDKEAGQCTRQPKPFIGCIRRRKVHHSFQFATLDEIQIFTLETVPYGKNIPLKRTAKYLTNWDAEEGLPIHAEPLRSTAARFWEERVCGNANYIYCLPVAHRSIKTSNIYRADQEFVYKRGIDQPSIGYYSANAFSYEAFVPHTNSTDIEDFEESALLSSICRGMNCKY